MSISDTTGSLIKGNSIIDLSAMADKPTGVWPKGWYPAEVIEGYTAGGHQFLTETTLSRKQDSYNFRLCVRVANGEELRTNFKAFNYRPEDFTADRITLVNNLRQEFAGQKGSWQGFEDAQRSSMALGQLGQLQSATSIAIQISADGVIDPTPYIGSKCFVRLTINDETGYNEVNAFSKYPTGTEPKAKGKKRG